MRSLKLFGPVEVNLCETGPHSPPARLCSCCWGLRSGLGASSVHDKKGGKDSPAFVIAKWKICCCLFPPLLPSHCEPARSQISSAGPAAEKEVWHGSCSRSWTLLYSINDCCVWSRGRRLGPEEDGREKNNEMLRPLWAFPSRACCVFPVIIVVRTVRPCGEGTDGFWKTRAGSCRPSWAWPSDWQQPPPALLPETKPLNGIDLRVGVVKIRQRGDI